MFGNTLSKKYLLRKMVPFSKLKIFNEMHESTNGFCASYCKNEKLSFGTFSLCLGY